MYYFQLVYGFDQLSQTVGCQSPFVSALYVYWVVSCGLGTLSALLANVFNLFNYHSLIQTVR